MKRRILLIIPQLASRRSVTCLPNEILNVIMEVNGLRNRPGTILTSKQRPSALKISRTWSEFASDSMLSVSGSYTVVYRWSTRSPWILWETTTPYLLPANYALHLSADHSWRASYTACAFSYNPTRALLTGNCLIQSLRPWARCFASCPT
jgi:hypothetical protein